jgi:hypothetical protein
MLCLILTKLQVSMSTWSTSLKFYIYEQNKFNPEVEWFKGWKES